MSKKFYWLKLKNDFFNQREVKKLRKIAGGDTFTIIYLKMQLLSIKNGGVITFERTEARLDEQLSLELDEELENVRLTLAFLEANSLIENLNEDDYLLNKVPELIGSETDAAERMRKMRNRVTPQLQNVTQSKSKEIEKDIELEKKQIGQMSGQMSDKYPPEIELERYIELERDIELERELNTSKKTKNKRGTFVPPTLEEIEAYIKQNNYSVEAKRFFDYFEAGDWVDSKGNKVKNWKQKLITWSKKEEPKKTDTKAYGVLPAEKIGSKQDFGFD